MTNYLVCKGYAYSELQLMPAYKMRRLNKLNQNVEEEEAKAIAQAANPQRHQTGGFSSEDLEEGFVGSI